MGIISVVFQKTYSMPHNSIYSYEPFNYVLIMVLSTLWGNKLFIRVLTLSQDYSFSNVIFFSCLI